jgi:hypothetical protein
LIHSHRNLQVEAHPYYVPHPIDRLQVKRDYSGPEEGVISIFRFKYRASFSMALASLMVADDGLPSGRRSSSALTAMANESSLPPTFAISGVSPGRPEFAAPAINKMP